MLERASAGVELPFQISMAFQTRRGTGNKSRHSGVALHDSRACLGVGRARTKRKRECLARYLPLCTTDKFQLEGTQHTSSGTLQAKCVLIKRARRHGIENIRLAKKRVMGNAYGFCSESLILSPVHTTVLLCRLSSAAAPVGVAQPNTSYKSSDVAQGGRKISPCGTLS